MKKIMFALVAFIALTACKKEVECTCTVTLDGAEFGKTTTTFPSKSDCEAASSETETVGIVSKTTCVVE